MARCIVESALRGHRALGPGLLKNVYEGCLCHELRKAGLKAERQIILPVLYDDLQFDAGLRLDVIVADLVIAELKAVEHVLPVHKAQVLTYLKLTGMRLRLLINFNVPMIKDGLQRVIL